MYMRKSNEGYIDIADQYMSQKRIERALEKARLLTASCGVSLTGRMHICTCTCVYLQQKTKCPLD